MKSIEIGIKINELLKQILPELKNKIYPLVSELDTTLPFIVYKKTSIIPKYIKHNITEEEIHIEITIVSDNYKQSVDLAQKIKDELQYKILEDVSIYFTGNYESYNDAYIQTLTFKLIK